MTLLKGTRGKDNWVMGKPQILQILITKAPMFSSKPKTQAPHISHCMLRRGYDCSSAVDAQLQEKAMGWWA